MYGIILMIKWTSFLSINVQNIMYIVTHKRLCIKMKKNISYRLQYTFKPIKIDKTKPEESPHVLLSTKTINVVCRSAPNIPLFINLCMFYHNTKL